MKAIITAFVGENDDELLSVAHDIHAHPELSFKELKASKILTNTAENFGLRVERAAYGLATAFESKFGNNNGPNMAVLTKYDALPGIGHSCGPNLIATAVLGAILALDHVKGKLKGTVTLLGTPTEERDGGKELMTRTGVFDSAYAAIMMHPAGVNLEKMRYICVAEVDVIWVDLDYLDLKPNWPLAENFQAHAESLGRKFFPLEKLSFGGIAA